MRRVSEDTTVSEMSEGTSTGKDIASLSTMTKFKPCIAKSILVRILLLLGNIVSVWRLTLDTDNPANWGWSGVCGALLFIEGFATVYWRKGVERKWWCPCFLVYLSTTLPVMWLLQLNQYNQYEATLKNIAEQRQQTKNSSGLEINVDMGNNSVANGTSPADDNKSFDPLSVLLDLLSFSLEQDTWVSVVEQTLIYLIVFSRWILPRSRQTSRVFLASLLLEFLGIASDIMELLALFDEEPIRTNLTVTYWLLATWSASFLQFIPTLVHKKRFKRLRSVRMRAVDKACGEYFADVVSTLMTIFLQDLPFTVLRLYVMIELEIVTKSLLFFVLKNLVSLMLLFYQLFVICGRLPCCCIHTRAKDVDISATANGRRESEPEVRSVYTSVLM